MLLTATSAALVLAGCTGTDGDAALPKDYGQDWLSRMSSRLAADHGGAGGQLLAEGSSRTARAVVALQYELEGPYDVLAVCRSAATVRVTVRGLTVNGDGQSDDRGDVLGAEDVACGATSRIRIEVPEESDGVELSPPGRPPGEPSSTP